MTGKQKKRFHIPGLTSFFASLISIGVGLLFGFILLVLLNPQFAGQGFISLVTAGLKSTDKLAKVLYQAAPLMMTGLSVGFAF